MTEIKPPLYYALMTGYDQVLSGILMAVTSEQEPERGRSARVSGAVMRRVQGTNEYRRCESYSRLKSHMHIRFNTIKELNSFIEAAHHLYDEHQDQTSRDRLMHEKAIELTQLTGAKMKKHWEDLSHAHEVLRQIYTKLPDGNAPEVDI